MYIDEIFANFFSEWYCYIIDLSQTVYFFFVINKNYDKHVIIREARHMIKNKNIHELIISRKQISFTKLLILPNT